MRLLPSDARDSVERTFNAVFMPSPFPRLAGYADTRGVTFRPQCTRRWIVNTGTREFWPNKHLGYIEALVAAATAVGDREAYVRPLITWGEPSDPQRASPGLAYSLTDQPNDFIVADEEAKRLGIELQAFTMLENVIFSPSAQWGVAFDEDLWGILGGTEAFMRVFAERTPVPLDDEMHRHLGWCRWIYQRVERERALTWIPRHVAYIVGRERAEQLLSEFGVPIPPDAW